MLRIITDSFSYRISFELKIIIFPWQKNILPIDLTCDLCFRPADDLYITIENVDNI